MKLLSILHTIQTVVLSVAFLFPVSAPAWEYQAGVLIDERLSLSNNFFDSLSGKFQRGDTENQLAVSPNLYVSAGNRLGFSLLADLLWTHSWEENETDDLDAEIANAYLSFAGGDFSSNLGIQTFQFGQGHIMSSDEPGIAIQYQPAQPLTFSLEAAKIMESSPILSARLDYSIGFLETISLFGAWYQDRDSSFADMLNYQDQALTRQWLYSRNRTLWLLNQTNGLTFSKSEGDLYWFGCSGSLFIGDFFLSGVMILETGSGSITLDIPNRTWKFDLSAYRADLELSYTLTDRLSIASFLFLTSGKNRKENDINVFIAPMPRYGRTAIFFSPAFSDQIEENFLSKGGIHWAGVVAPGMKIDYDLSETWSSGISIAAFFPEESPSDERTWYGWEMDVLCSYRFQQNYTFFCEFGWFEHGDFYRFQGRTPEPATLFTLGMNAFF